MAALGRSQPDNSFKPNPLRGSAKFKGRASASGRERTLAHAWQFLRISGRPAIRDGHARGVLNVDFAGLLILCLDLAMRRLDGRTQPP